MFILILTLILNEVYTLFYGDLLKFPYIDTSDQDDRIRLNINTTLIKTDCNDIFVGYEDETGTSLPNIQHTIYKIELDKYKKFKDKD